LSQRGTEEIAQLVGVSDTDTRAALARAHALLDRLPALERAAFGLRFFEGMRLPEVAEVLEVSLSTAKRRLRRARERFARLAARDALLSDWLGEEDLR
jgi:RNA polymerase sigma-70 factor (ECF subfamily)